MRSESTQDPAENAQLTAWVDARLKALPPLQAPASLQSRVLAELARLEAVPWWHSNFRSWPVLVQFGFALLALGVTQGALMLLSGSSAVQFAATVGETFSVVLRSLRGALPTNWLVIITTASCVAYAVIVAGGAAAFRILRTER
jgi:hypothetical protein